MPRAVACAAARDKTRLVLASLQAENLDIEQSGARPQLQSPEGQDVAQKFTDGQGPAQEAIKGPLLTLERQVLLKDVLHGEAQGGDCHCELRVRRVDGLGANSPFRNQLAQLS